MRLLLQGLAWRVAAGRGAIERDFVFRGILTGRIQSIVATVREMAPRVHPTLGSEVGWRGRPGGRPGLALGFLSPGAAAVSGVRPVRPPRSGAAGSLEAGGAAPYHARPPPVMSGGRSPPPSVLPVSGRLVQELRHRSAGVFQPRVLRGLPFSSAATSSSRSPGDGQPGWCPWGSTGAAARWWSRCCPAARASAGRRSSLHASGHGDLPVRGHLLALVPGQRPAQLRGQRRRSPCSSPPRAAAASCPAAVQQQREPGATR